MPISSLSVFPPHTHRQGSVDRHPNLLILEKTTKKSKNCKKELEYADKLDKELIVVKLDPDADILGHGGISIILANLIYVSFKLLVDGIW